MEVGPGNVNADIEYKHLIKRERSSLLRNKGVTIHGVLINAAVLKQHLAASGLEQHHIETIVSPADRQVVKLAYDLLSSIAVLPCALPMDSSITHATQTALHLVNKLYGGRGRASDSGGNPSEKGGMLIISK